MKNGNQILIFLTCLLFPIHELFAQCTGGGFWFGGTPVAGTLDAVGMIQGTIPVNVHSQGVFAAGRPIYLTNTAPYGGFSYRSLRIVRGAGFGSGTYTSFKLSTPLDATFIHFRVSDIRGDGFNAEAQRIQGYLNGVEVGKNFVDPTNGANISGGNIINGGAGTTSLIQSSMRVFFTGPVDSVVVTRTSFSDYVIVELFSRCDILLPFTLVKFTAKVIEKSVLLHWTIREAWGFEQYEIERSPDGLQWENIGSKNINETSDTKNNYQFTDSFPLQGRNFYRIRSEDIDGKLTYSSVIALSTLNRISGTPIRVMPNPGSNIFRIYTGNEIPSRVLCYTSEGRLMQILILDRSNFILYTSTWKKGIYYLRIIQPSGQQQVTRIIKN